jgi:hypothetical protein
MARKICKYTVFVYGSEHIYIITFIKAGKIFCFRKFFQKLSEFRQLPKTRVHKNLDFCLFVLRLFF